jgi:hypothetical protein
MIHKIDRNPGRLSGPLDDQLKTSSHEPQLPAANLIKRAKRPLPQRVHGRVRNGPTLSDVVLT